MGNEPYDLKGLCIEIKTACPALFRIRNVQISTVLDISKLTATDMFQIKGIALQVGKPVQQCTLYNIRVETARRRRQQRARQKLFAGEV